MVNLMKNYGTITPEGHLFYVVIDSAASVSAKHAAISFPIISSLQIDCAVSRTSRPLLVASVHSTKLCSNSHTHAPYAS